MAILGAARTAGEAKRWHKVVLEFEGPRGGEDAATFLDHRLDVVFRHEGSGRTVTVPGHFAADGRAADSGASSGSVWRAHFNPPEAGSWSWEASFRKGDGVAVAASAKAGASAGAMDGASGRFRVAESDKGGSDLRGKGVLEHDGDRYLSFAGDGTTFLKSGVGSPENFLAYSGFDNTPGSHDYRAHARHFEGGDPTWSGGEGRGIVGAVNYLADQGVNSAYMLLQNVGGDGRDVWPWAASDLDGIRKNAGNGRGSFNLTEDARAFDVSKLDQWERVFEHMQKKGIVLHLFLQETENDHLLNDGEMGTERALFMREMVARFGHHNGVIWNLGEETTNSAGQLRAHSKALKALDPYDHPVALHTYPNQHDKYRDFEGSETLDVLSFQTSNDSQLPDLDRYLGGAEKAGRPVVAFLDEPGSADVGTAAQGDRGWQQNHEDLRDVLWRFYMEGGSGAEWYFGYNTAGGKGGDLAVEDFSSREEVYGWARHARAFFEDLPLGRMEEADGLAGSSRGGDQALAAPGEAYAIYLANGGDATLDLRGQSGAFEVTWYDPRSGARREGEAVSGGAKVDLGSAPYDAGREWAVLVERAGGKAGGPAPKPAPKPQARARRRDRPRRGRRRRGRALRGRAGGAPHEGRARGDAGRGRGVREPARLGQRHLGARDQAQGLQGRRLPALRHQQGPLQHPRRRQPRDGADGVQLPRRRPGRGGALLHHAARDEAQHGRAVRPQQRLLRRRGPGRRGPLGLDQALLQRRGQQLALGLDLRRQPQQKPRELHDRRARRVLDLRLGPLAPGRARRDPRPEGLEEHRRRRPHLAPRRRNLQAGTQARTQARAEARSPSRSPSRSRNPSPSRSPPRPTMTTSSPSTSARTNALHRQGRNRVRSG